MRLVDDCGLTYLHVFPFSPRPGTPAAKMPQVDGNAIKARAAQLRARGEDRLAAYLASRIGATESVLVERGLEGRTEGFAQVTLDRALAPGTIHKVRIVGVDPKRLIGKLAE